MVKSSKPKAIICDIDGTLAHMTKAGRLRHGRKGAFRWDEVDLDEPDFVVWDLLVKYYYHGYEGQSVTVILVSGRDEVCREMTETWLNDTFDIPYHELFMRPKDNNEKDTIIKRRIYDKEIADKYDVLFVLDDRDQVVKMWREDLGLKVLQVAPGSF